MDEDVDENKSDDSTKTDAPRDPALLERQTLLSKEQLSSRLDKLWESSNGEVLVVEVG